MKFLITLFLLSSCTQFIKSTDDDYFEQYNFKGKAGFNILFSHNINGETHPCGCRNFPLGGLPQAYGVIKSHQNDLPTLYIDSGDTFFPSPVIPDFLLTSTKYKAKKIAEALDKLGLNFITPGDQDFALGENFLIDLTKQVKFKFLISNASKEMKLKHEKLIHLNANGLDLFFIGVTDPAIFNNGTYKKLFTSPLKAIKEQMLYIEKNYSSKNKKIILVSHSGIDTDRKYAKEVKGIDWIIGAHSQSYLRFSEDVGQTQLVQVLSRNHYIGKIYMPLSTKAKEKYEIVEARDETKDLVKNNPLVAWLDDFKTELDKIQLEEQRMATADTSSFTHLKTAQSCFECHQKQGEFWQTTSHSLAFKTLIDAKAANNSTCIECHSVGFKTKEGFLISDKIVLSENKDFDINKYWAEFNSQVFKEKKSIRSLSSAQRKAHSNEWMKFDKKHKVTHNFSNVQCLNCHQQAPDHPFDISDNADIGFESTCIKCHTSDQSPEWYDKDSKGLATSLNKEYFAKKLKEVSCPKIEN